MKCEAKTEEEMRDAEVPTPATLDELHEYIDSLVNREHDYGTCVYAMSMAAVAAYNYVACKLGVTAFQASCADLNIIRRTRHMERFIVLDAAQLLYPQYDLPGKLGSFIAEQRAWLREEATKKLAELNKYVHPDVRAHWEKLAQ